VNQCQSECKIPDHSPSLLFPDDRFGHRALGLAQGSGPPERRSPQSRGPVPCAPALRKRMATQRFVRHPSTGHRRVSGAAFRLPNTNRLPTHPKTRASVQRSHFRDMEGHCSDLLPGFARSRQPRPQWRKPSRTGGLPLRNRDGMLPAFHSQRRAKPRSWLGRLTNLSSHAGRLPKRRHLVPTACSESGAGPLRGRAKLVVDRLGRLLEGMTEDVRQDDCSSLRDGERE
jgi:hypothetical protein